MKKLTILLLVFCQTIYGQTANLRKIDTKVKATFRCLSIPDDTVAWVGGTEGWVGVSGNGGNDWTFGQVKGFETCDFRSLYAFDGKTAVIANAGAPAYILRTEDGGKNWKVVYKNTDSAAFFDGIDFWDNKNGIIYGDPLKGRMLVLNTTDGGKTWKEAPDKSRPMLEKNEASFAASGTAIRCMKAQKVVIATGGRLSRLFISDDAGGIWRYKPTPIMQGRTTTGAFSVACWDDNNAIIVGGDYKRDSLSVDNVFYTKNGGSSWVKPTEGTRGYRECVEYISQNVVIAVGPGGVDVSNSGGMTWKPLSDDKGLHVIRKSRKGKVVILAGSEGNIERLDYSTKK